MPSHVALLRGINVGGRNKVAMPALRAVVESLGHTDVATYIQSGNVVFTATDGEPGALAEELERAIESELGVPARVVVLSRDELAEVARANPYPDELNPKALHAVFLVDEPGDALRELVAAECARAGERGSRDEAKAVGRTLYVHTPDGYGRSDMAARLLRAKAATGTGRNWATVTKLLAMLEA